MKLFIQLRQTQKLYSTLFANINILFTFHFSLIDPFPFAVSFSRAFLSRTLHFTPSLTHTHDCRHLQADDDRCQKVRLDDQLTLGEDYALTDACTRQSDAQLG